MDPQSATPLRRRAALGALDANAMLPTSPRAQVGFAKGSMSPVKKAVLQAPPARKRGADGDGDGDVSPGASKKACLGDEDTRSRTHSPDASSVFDASGDASWATTTTEPDTVERIAAAAIPGRLTREQAREKAEILRLRLGLASYKLRTGQTGLSLADLQPQPLPPHRRVRVQSPSSSSASDSTPSSQEQQQKQSASSSSQHSSPDQSQQTHSEQHEDSQDTPIETDDTTDALPDSTKTPAIATQAPQHRHLGDDKSTSSALRGGAANGLLSLARGSSSP